MSEDDATPDPLSRGVTGQAQAERRMRELRGPRRWGLIFLRRRMPYARMWEYRMVPDTRAPKPSRCPLQS